MARPKITLDNLRDLVAVLEAMTLRMQAQSLEGQVAKIDGFSIESPEMMEHRAQQKHSAEIMLALCDEWRRLSPLHCPAHTTEAENAIGGTVDELENAMISILRGIKEQDDFTSVVGVNAENLA